jgi:hypothetical protein
MFEHKFDTAFRQSLYLKLSPAIGVASPAARPLSVSARSRIIGAVVGV